MAGSRRASRRFRLLAVALSLGCTAATVLAVPPIIGPRWVELTPQKQQVLKPLAAEWDQFDATRRKKWLDVADRYPKMSADEQARLQAQMQAWTKLTPEQRHAARTKYRNVQKASPEQKEALKHMWDEYQALPDDEKKRFKESAAEKAPVKPVKTPTVAKRPERTIPLHLRSAKAIPPAPPTPPAPAAPPAAVAGPEQAAVPAPAPAQ